MVEQLRGVRITCVAGGNSNSEGSLKPPLFTNPWRLWGAFSPVAFTCTDPERTKKAPSVHAKESLLKEPK